MASSILTWMNRERAARGLVPLRSDYRLAGLAKDRAGYMASVGVLMHSAGGGTGDLAERGIQWYGTGENVGMTTAPWGTTAASSLYGMWRDSAVHNGLMMSTAFNYVGVGVAYRSATGATYASMIFTESADHTTPVGLMVSASRTGSSVTFKWRGYDRRLQTHTAGLRNFDVAYRVDAGTWRLIRTYTTTTWVTLTGRPSGHGYSIRVRARDGRGNLSSWSSTLRVWVP